MKYLLVVFIAILGFYLYFHLGLFDPKVEVKTHQDIYNKLEFSPVNTHEILVGADEFALRMCADNGLQEILGEDYDSCKQRLIKFKPICMTRIFGDKHKDYSDKEQIKSLVFRYTKCVSA